MFIRNDFVLILSALIIGAVVRPAHSAPHSYRQLSPEEIQRALAAPRTKGPRECQITDLSMTQGMRLPPGVILKQDGYYCDVTHGKMTYSFLEASPRSGKEVLFACGWNPLLWPAPWYMWVGVPKACGIAVIDTPATRADQLEDWKKLTHWDMSGGSEPLQTDEGKEYYSKLKPYFERVLRQCAKSGAEDDRRYAWMGRISSKGRVVRTGVLITKSDDDYPETSPYMECIRETMKKLDLPPPPHVLGGMIGDGGWPTTFRWRHGGGGDELKNEW